MLVKSGIEHVVEGKLEAVARDCGCSGIELREAVLAERGDATEIVCISVRSALYGRLEIRADSRIVRVARRLQIEPEDLRDAIVRHSRVRDGEVCTLSVRVPAADIRR